MLTIHPPHPTGAAEPHPGAVWFDLESPTDTEIAVVAMYTGLAVPSRRDLSGIEPSSRLSFDGKALRLAAPVVAEMESERPDLVYVGLVLTPALMITVRHHALPLFETVHEADLGAAPAIFVALLEAFVGAQADHLEAARARLDDVSHLVFRGHERRREAQGRPAGLKPRTRNKRSETLMRAKLQTLGHIGEAISMTRESLLAVDRLAAYAPETVKSWFTPELGQRLAAVRTDIDALSLFEEHLLGKVQFLLDAILGFISIEQNEIFRVLTIASVVGIFPTLVAGWYGMNFHNMPEYGWALGLPVRHRRHRRLDPAAAGLVQVARLAVTATAGMARAL
jgi:magnesium transporter